MSDGGQIIALSGREEIAAARLQLLAATRYKLAVHLPALPMDVLAQPDELAHLRRIAISGRGAEIRLLLADPDALLRSGHRLLELAQRLSSAIQIRIPARDEGDAADARGWLLNDQRGYLFQADAAQPLGRFSAQDGPGHAPLLLDFEQLWQRAAPASQLQALGL